MIYVLQWPSTVGGADTRLIDLLKLLSPHFPLTLVPNFDEQLQQKQWTAFLDSLGIKYLSWSQLPRKDDGVALAFCNFRPFIELWRLERIKTMGLKFIWSNDMMYHTPGEFLALHAGLVPAVIYTSEFHKEVLGPGFRRFSKPEEHIIENYIDPAPYKPAPRDYQRLTAGKLSRADYSKYSEHFPLFYETMFPQARYAVMGWSEKLAEIYREHTFDERWTFHKQNELTAPEFLQRLDVFLYDCHHTFIENQSRALLEAHLMGLPVIAPAKWNFPNMISHGNNGFLWNTLEECRAYCLILQTNKKLLADMSRFAAASHRDTFASQEHHLAKWKALLSR